jgi:hypothetical protein
MLASVVVPVCIDMAEETMIEAETVVNSNPEKHLEDDAWLFACKNPCMLTESLMSTQDQVRYRSGNPNIHTKIQGPFPHL